jgi:threonine dehydratase
VIRRTPLVRPGGAAGDRLGAQVALKLENLQITGSFKPRGAFAAVAALPADARAAGVVTASAGNHGAGMALACAWAGVRCTVVVPESAPRIKRATIAGLGADLLVEGDDYDSSEVIARELARSRGARFVSAFDDDDVMAGSGGSIAAELLDQAPDLARVMVPIGGGGLAAGLCLALSERGVELIGVQPETNCAMHRSMAEGRALVDYRGGPTLADALSGACGSRTYAVCSRHLDSIALVSEAAIREAVAFLYREVGTIAEPSGAAAVAAVLSGATAAAPHAGTTAVLVTGGNIDAELLDEILAGS